MKTTLAALTLGAITANAARRRWQDRRAEDLRGKTVLITGGSRGLGLALAEEFAREGARLVICGRDEAQLQRASIHLVRLGAEVLALPCDVSDRAAVEALVAAAEQRFGGIDVLVNNAGIISVGPLQAQRVEDFEEAMDVMFWGAFWPTMAVLEGMRRREYGRIVNITSVGGKVSVPHLLPYAAAKFATVGFSEGLRAEVAGSGVAVTTVVPGLMRTGSHLNARFTGRPSWEFTWFSILGNLPLTTVNARDAARRIVAATRRGEAEVTLTWPAVLISRMQGAMPGVTTTLLGMVNRAMPRDPGAARRHAASGWDSETPVTRSFVTALGRQAARQLLQYPAGWRHRAEDRPNTATG
jgi:NAD(P)-dependent dehydrogenase (short-subunit alcohol dehydrogenase family)